MACCNWLPVAEIGKPANTRCRFLRLGKGCVIHANRPRSCRAWSCGWLLGAPIVGRPDRVGFAVDPIPDTVLATDWSSGAENVSIDVMQLWADPMRPDAWDRPSTFRFLEDQHSAALVRHGSDHGIALIPPWMNDTGRWARKESLMAEDITCST